MGIQFHALKLADVDAIEEFVGRGSQHLWPASRAPKCRARVPQIRRVPGRLKTPQAGERPCHLVAFVP
jgi:hypothetical protein